MNGKGSQTTRNSANKPKISLALWAGVCWYGAPVSSHRIPLVLWCEGPFAGLRVRLCKYLALHQLPLDVGVILPGKMGRVGVV